MKSDWKIVTINDCADVVGDGLHGTPQYSQNGEYAFVNGNNLINGKVVIKSDTKRVIFSEFEKYKKELNDRTILVSINGTLGNVSAYNNEKIILGKSVCFINVKNGYDKNFLFYVLSSPTFRNYMETNSTGTTIKNFSLKQMREYSFSLPDICLQKKIAAILSALDEKIATNRAINDNLLQQAQAVFAKEFLSFDTTPEGWKESSLLGIADYLNGLAMQKFRPKDGENGLPVLKIKELRQGSCDASSELCSPSIKKEYIVHDGDVIFSWSGSLLVDFWCGGTCGLNQHLFKVTSTSFDKWFYFAWTDHHLQKFAAIAADMATTMGHIKREELAKAEVLVPPQAEYERIGGLLAPIYDLVVANRIENRKLATLRDELLPRLMSGDLDVSEVSL